MNLQVFVSLIEGIDHWIIQNMLGSLYIKLLRILSVIKHLIFWRQK